MKPLSPKAIPPERFVTWISRAAQMMFECPVATFLSTLPMLLLLALASNVGLNVLATLVLLIPTAHAMWWRSTKAAFALDKRPIAGIDVGTAGASFSASQAAIFGIIAIIMAVIGMSIHNVPVAMFTASMLTCIVVGSWVTLGYGMVWSLIAAGVPPMEAVDMAHAADDMNRSVMTRVWIALIVVSLVPVVNVLAAMLMPYVGFVAFKDIFLDIETDAEEPSSGTLVSA